MSLALPLPPDLWNRLCEFLATHATCNATIHQHEGRVVFLDLNTVKERIKVGHCGTTRRATNQEVDKVRG